MHSQDFFGKLDRIIGVNIPTFRLYLTRLLINALYYQNVQFDVGVDIQGRKTAEQYTSMAEGWLQQNYYQAILTMKQSLLMDVNPVPVIKGPHRAEQEASALLTTKQAIRCILSEVDLDGKVAEEILNLLVLDNSFRYTYVQPEEVEETLSCPACNILIDNESGECPECGFLGEMAATQDATLQLDVIAPWWVIPLPFSAPSLEEVGILVRMDILDRHRLKKKLALALPGACIDIDEIPEPDEPDKDVDASYSGVFPQGLGSLNRLWNLVKSVDTTARTFGAAIPTFYGLTPMPNRELNQYFYVEIWLRDGAINDEHGDIVLHFLDGRYLGATSKRIDDHWVHFVNRRVPGRLLGDGEEAVLDQQDALNSLLSLSFISAMSRSFSVAIANRNYLNVNDLMRLPNFVVPMAENIPGEVDVRKIFHIEPGVPITPDVKELREAIISAMQILAQTYPVLFGQLPPGVEAYKAIEVLRAQSLRAMRPFLVNWYSSHFKWLKQALRLAKAHWGRQRLTKLEGVSFVVHAESIDPDVNFEITPSLITPTGEQDRRQMIISGVQANLIDVSDPLNRIKVLAELGLDDFEQALISIIDEQNAEIEQMLRHEQSVAINPETDNHLVHHYVVRNFLRSEYGRYLREEKPLLYQMIATHGRIHSFIADGRIDEAVTEFTRAGWLDYIMREPDEPIETTIRRLEQASERMKRERERMEEERRARLDILRRQTSAYLPTGEPGESSEAPESGRTPLGVPPGSPFGGEEGAPIFDNFPSQEGSEFPPRQ